MKKHKALKDKKSKLLTEKVERKGSTSLPPLLNRLSERPPEKLNYIGVSFGATPKLIRFWKKAGYLPVYLRQTMVCCQHAKFSAKHEIIASRSLASNFVGVYSCLLLLLA